MSHGNRTLRDSLARYMDPQAFEPVPKRIGKARAEDEYAKRKRRREITTKRADAALRFFAKPGAVDELTAYLARRALGEEKAS